MKAKLTMFQEPPDDVRHLLRAEILGIAFLFLYDISNTASMRLPSVNQAPLGAGFSKPTWNKDRLARHRFIITTFFL